MVAAEIAAYLAVQIPALVPGTNLFDVPFPLLSQDQAVAVVPYGHWGPPDRVFGVSLSPTIGDKPLVQIQSREMRDNSDNALSLALQCFQKLRNFAGVLSGVTYYDILCRSQPVFGWFDGKQRPVFYFEMEVDKAESPS